MINWYAFIMKNLINYNLGIITSLINLIWLPVYNNYFYYEYTSQFVNAIYFPIFYILTIIYIVSPSLAAL